MNLTPHIVRVFVDGQHSDVLYPASGTEARCSSVQQRPLYQLKNNVPVWTPQDFTGVTGIDEIGADVHGIIVSMPVAQYLREARFPKISRLYVYCPDTSPDAVRRDDDGRVVGTRRLVVYYQPTD